MKKENYFIGLDIGTNSVGYAVTDVNYNLIKFKGEPMWGTTVFDDGNQAAERRAFRTARRRLDRRQQRILLTQEIFSKEIAKVDEKFYIRLKESALFREDTSTGDSYTYFNDVKYSDIDFYKEYKTVHHLICELMDSTAPHDVRLVYMAVAWLMAHRGHFLNEVDKRNISKVLDFSEVYRNFMNCFEKVPWSCEAYKFAEVIKHKSGVTKKEKAFFELLFNGKKPKTVETDYCDIAIMIKLLSGGRTTAQKLFKNEEYAEVASFSLYMPDDDFYEVTAQLGDDGDILEKLRAVYDWSLLADILSGSNTISEAKVKAYEQHKADLHNLKKFVKKYVPEKYASIFRNAGEGNYVAYSYNEKSLNNSQRIKKKATKEIFCDYLKKELSKITPNPEDEEFYQDMMQRLDTYSFMPKQVNGDNRVIPYQLYWTQLNRILINAQEYLPFLKEKDCDGISNTEKLLSIFEFRVPYYVGPLRKDNSDNAWIVRKSEGKIYPWNFESMVDLDKSEQAFIARMTNKCTYLCDEDVIAKNSLLYSKYNILNEINNIKINGEDISVDVKQKIFGLFEKYPKVTVRAIKDYLISGGYMQKSDALSGIDITVKSNYKPYHDFKRLINSSTLSLQQVEAIIERLTFCEDKSRIRKYLRNEYPILSNDDVSYISKLKYNDFGRLSAKFLNSFSGVRKKTGEVMTIIQALWETNDNLMQLLSDNYTFKAEIEKYTKNYYSENPSNLETLLDSMYISNSVKRPIYRTLDIIKDIKSVMNKAPDKVFVEMARGGGEKGKRSVSRRSQIEELYKNVDKNETRELLAELGSVDDSKLQSEKLFLYFMQLGRSMYSNTSIDFSKLKTDEYNVDHIYPQSKVKDDSITNKVLVLSTENGNKGDIYPIDTSIRKNMTSYWKMLLDSKLISEEKYKRLTRSYAFTDEEKQGFINRQLVETRQSTKAVTTVLHELFPESEIVYVKAGLASDFRKEFDMLKSRLVNDLHHAKDAYLNIVCGNVYNSKFTKRYFSVNDEYSIKTRTVFTNPVKLGDTVVWDGKESLAKVRVIMSKNNVHLTRYSYIRRGGLFDQMPLKATAGLVERKKGLDTAKYGGYNKTTASCFILAKYEIKNKVDIMIVPIELLYIDKLLANEDAMTEYIHTVIASIENKDIEEVKVISLPLGMRPIKINTVFSTDGFKVCVTGKSNGGKILGLTSIVSLVTGTAKEQYIKKLEVFDKKKQLNKEIKLNEVYDKITKDENIALYDWFTDKLNSSFPYALAVFANQFVILKNGRNKFLALSIENQVTALLNILMLFKTFRAAGCDLTSIGGVTKAGVYTMSSKLSNWKKYSDVRIIDTSTSGIREKVSCNLLELL